MEVRVRVPVRAKNLKVDRLPVPSLNVAMALLCCGLSTSTATAQPASQVREIRWATTVESDAIPFINPEKIVGYPDGQTPSAGELGSAKCSKFLECTHVSGDGLAALLGVSQQVLDGSDFIAFERNGTSGFGFEGSTWKFKVGFTQEVVSIPNAAHATGAVSVSAYDAFFGTTSTGTGDYPFILIDLHTVDPLSPDFSVEVVAGAAVTQTPDVDAMGVFRVPFGASWAAAVAPGTPGPANPNNLIGAPDGAMITSPDDTIATVTGSQFNICSFHDKLALAAALGVTVAKLEQSDVLAFEFNGTPGLGFEPSDWKFKVGGMSENIPIPSGANASGALSISAYESFFGVSTGKAVGDFPFVLIHLQSPISVHNPALEITVKSFAAPGFSPDIDAIGVLGTPVCIDAVGDSILPYGTGCPGTGAFVPSLSVTGCIAPGGSLGLDIKNGKPGATPVLFLGFGTTPINLTASCALQIAPLFPTPIYLPNLTGSAPGQGTLSITGLGLPASTPSGVAFSLQVIFADAGAPGGVASTNPVKVLVGP